jgi:hypothetical protein
MCTCGSSRVNRTRSMIAGSSSAIRMVIMPSASARGVPPEGAA